MSNVLVLGAGGQIARHVITMLDGEQGVALTLFARNTSRLARVPANATLVQGDVLDAARLAKAVKGQDIVYANLAGEDLDDQTNAVIAAMQSEGVQRLVFVLSLGIYRETPGKFGEWNEAIIGEDLKRYRRAADAIEASGLDYTILRPAWLTDEDEVDYETTGRNDPFKGTVVSRKSVADLIAKTIRAPHLHSNANLGVNKPNTDADKPYFM